MRRLVETVLTSVTERNRELIAGFLVASLIAGFGVGNLTLSSSVDQFETGSTESEKLNYIESNFSTRGENVTTVQVIIRGDDVLSKESLLEMLEFVRAVRTDERTADSIADTSPGGVANVIATAAIRGDDAAAIEPTEPPSMEEQITTVESMSEEELDRVIRRTLSTDNPATGEALAFMPTSFEPGDTNANATILVLYQFQRTATFEGLASQRTIRIQQHIHEQADDIITSNDATVLGNGIVSEEIDRSVIDSLFIVGPLALLFVLLVLFIAYRDPIDIVLGTIGILLVLVWTLGVMGWLGITFNQIFVAMLVLLIGLSIDFAIHMFMRYREVRQRSTYSVRKGMRTALLTVGVALTWVTVTTAFGFLSNLISSIGPIREFGFISAIGIVVTLGVFGILIPAVKVEIDRALEARQINRRLTAFGTGGSFSRLLTIGGRLAVTAPWIVVLLTLIVSAAGAYGALSVDTNFEQQDFLAEQPPEWMTGLPQPLTPGEYTTRQDLEYVNQHFLRKDAQAELLIEGGVANEDMLVDVARAHSLAAETGLVITLSNEESGIRSPLTVMQAVSAQNSTFAGALAEADTDGDGVPDRNIAELYDALFAVAPDSAATVIHRDGDEYHALRIVVPVRGDAATDTVTREMRGVAGTFDEPTVTATATGEPIIFELVQRSLLKTIVESLLITIATVGLFLLIVYALSAGSLSLGLVTLLPVVLNVSWIVGTMYLLGIPFNIVTGTITSLTIGLGVAYCIHMSDRYRIELERSHSIGQALERSLAGTGGALLGSAATSVGGFGVLVFAILPALQQFGIITALMIVYALLASLLVLPSLLVIWTRWSQPYTA